MNRPCAINKSTDTTAVLIEKFSTMTDDRDTFRDIFENANIGIFQSTIQGRYIRANPTLADMYGYECVDDMLEVLTDISHQLYVEDGRRDAFTQKLIETGAIENFESQVYCRDGTVIWISETARVVATSGGRAAYFEGFVKNVSERKRLEAQVSKFTQELEQRVQKRTSELLLEIERRRLAELSLKAALNEAQSATEAKSQFLASMSHELRTPLNAIIGFADAIRTELHGPIEPLEYAEYIDIIKGSGDHLLDLINDVLDLSKINSGTVDLRMVDVDVSEVMMGCLDLIGHRAAEAHVELKNDVDDNVDTIMRGDARRIKQVFLNLLSNAIKFTPPHGTVTVRIWDEAPGLLGVSVKDTGVGIAAQDIPKVLSEYGQVEHGLEHVGEGTGLGLPITKKLVELHGGVLSIDSKVGTGTTVSLSLPV